MTNVETIVNFISEQMSGEAIPPAGSTELNELSAAVGELLKHQSAQELQLLANRVIGSVIDRVSSNIQAEKTLLAFIMPGAGHA